MKHSEFHAAVGKIAGDRYFASEVDVSTGGAVSADSRLGRITTITYKAYIDGFGWGEGNTPDAAIAALVTPGAKPESLGDVAADIAAQPAPASDAPASEEAGTGAWF